MKVLLLTAIVAGFAAGAKDIQLPPPQKNGGMTLNEALSVRRTERSYSDKKIDAAKISQVLWSGFGINRPDGKRTAATARNRQEITLYLLSADRAWLYDAAGHKLVEKSKEDLRKLAGRYTAPNYIVIVCDRKLSGNSPREIHFSTMNVGYVSQNIYLACAGNNLGTCAIGMIVNPRLLAQKLQLKATEEILLVHSIGMK